MNKQQRADALRVGSSGLLAGIEPLITPDWPTLNEHAGRNDRLLHACLCAYAKHVLGNDDIGWDFLGDVLHSAICENIGDDNFVAWGETIVGQRYPANSRISGGDDK